MFPVITVLNRLVPGDAAGVCSLERISYHLSWKETSRVFRGASLRNVRFTRNFWRRKGFTVNTVYCYSTN